MTPKEAIRSYCSQCLGMNQWNHKLVEDCQGDQAMNGACPLYPYRMGRRVSLRAFRAHCLQCQGGSREAVIDCNVTSCPCYPYRLGKNPARKGLGHSAEFMQKVRGQGFERQESIFPGRGIPGHGPSELSPQPPGKAVSPRQEKRVK